MTKAVRSKDGGLPEVRVFKVVEGGVNLYVVCQCGNVVQSLLTLLFGVSN